MIINQRHPDGSTRRLAHGSVTMVTGRDEWSTTLETTGFDAAGERVTYRMIISHAELQQITDGPIANSGDTL